MPELKPDLLPSQTSHEKQQTTNGKLFIGPAGWDYPDWQGVVYPSGLKGAGRLAWLATLFQVVEINVTFYRPLALRDAERWLAAVAQQPEFRFTAKLWKIFTHERRLDPPELAQFQAGLEPLLDAGRLGMLLAQFPYSFHHTAENRDFLLRLKALLPKYPLAVEVRHRSWQQQAVQEFLREAGMDFCNIDQPQVSYPMGATCWVTGATGYLRCHGRRREKWFEFGEDRGARYDYLYGPEELAELAGRARALMEQAAESYVIFNNHPAGQAVANALELLHILKPDYHPALPACLAAVFPRLSDWAEVKENEKAGHLFD
ncbi:MAG: DUF72 domain-containing protein [Deltaproteobacteria bacterium]|nr:DUF72 domain-containing protein [Deltaproteobacteria bacterium]